MKIVPRLHALIVKGGWPESLASDWKGQEAELRALLAVARAADYESGPFVDEHHNSGECRLCRAIDRLERVSAVNPRRSA